MRTDGQRGCFLNLPSQNNQDIIVDDINYSNGGFSSITMNGQEVYKFAVREVPLIIDKLFKKTNYSSEKIDMMNIVTFLLGNVLITDNIIIIITIIKHHCYFFWLMLTIKHHHYHHDHHDYHHHHHDYHLTHYLGMQSPLCLCELDSLLRGF